MKSRSILLKKNYEAIKTIDTSSKKKKWFVNTIIGDSVQRENFCSISINLWQYVKAVEVEQNVKSKMWV